jgi:pterin-4a-carbinolamine dehydratase
VNFAFKLPFRDESLPITVEQSTWAHVDGGKKIRKTYEFTQFQQFHSFVSELLVKLRRMHHDAHIEIEGMKLTITLQTHVLDDVSEIDLEISRFCDALYEDVKHYYTAKKVRDATYE